MLITRESGIPLVGCIAFGIIDRGTNMLQVRPTTACNLKCLFCSTNANNKTLHNAEYIVEPNYLIETLRDVVAYKGCQIEAFIDCVGEATTYPWLEELISGIAKIQGIKSITMVTNGVLLTRERVMLLEKAGLKNINLSLHALDEKLAKELSGAELYDLKRIVDLTQDISGTGVKLTLVPVWLPGVNDNEIPRIIELAKRLNAGLGIQKYEVYRYGRRLKKAENINWWKFRRKLRQWEREHSVMLVSDTSCILKARELPLAFGRHEKVYAVVAAEGWIKGQMLAVAKNRAISVNSCNKKIGDRVRIRILENKNNIYVAELA